MSDNFDTAKNMIPFGEVQKIVEQRRCYNYERGCKFQTKWYLCTCCMMLKAVGSDFEDYYRKLQAEVSDFPSQMTYWQLEEFEKKYPYWEKWCNNYPRGTVS